MVLIDRIGPDIDKVSAAHYQQVPLYRRIAKNFFLIVFFSMIVFGSINFPAYFTMGRFLVNPQAFAYSLPEVAVSDKVISDPVYEKYSDNTLYIPKIGVQAPVGWDVNQGDVMSELQKHVVHLAGSGKPGEGKNIFLTGHSSNYWWKEGGFNSVFALLPQLEKGDQMVLVYKGKLKKYQVVDKKELKPSEVSSYVNGDEEKLTLMTCVPIGTNLRRLLVFADPI